jgi:hypothetical protein
MREIRALCFILTLFLITKPLANGAVIIDNHLLYYSSGVSTASSDKYENYYGSFCVGASIPKDFYLGWKSAYFSDKQTSSAGTMSITGLEMGPRVGYYLTKNHWSSFALSYLPVFNGNQTSETGVNSKLSGSAFQFEFNFAPDVFKGLSPGIAIYYQAGSFSSSTNSLNNTSVVSYSRNGFYPSIYLHWVLGSE